MNEPPLEAGTLILLRKGAPAPPKPEPKPGSRPTR